MVVVSKVQKCTTGAWYRGTQLFIPRGCRKGCRRRSFKRTRISFKDWTGTLKLLLNMGKSYDFVKIKCWKKMNCFTRATEVPYVINIALYNTEY